MTTPAPMTFGSENALVSIIIPTRDSSQTLRECLESIRKQRNPRIEVLVVDQDSRDSTRSIALSFNALVVDAKRTAFYHPPSHSRNLGFSKSTGKYVLHLDSDMELSSPDLISNCVKACRSAQAVIIPEIDVGRGFWAKCKSLERRCQYGRTWLESPRFFKRDVLEALSGYDSEITTGEDWELTDRLIEQGAPIARVSSEIRHHLGTLSLKSQLMKKYNYGKTMLLYTGKSNNQMGRRLVIYLVTYVTNARILQAYFYPVLLMRWIEAMGILAGIVRGKMTGERS
jgi:arabinofuranan 3-O-arabinosyltransferase